MFEAFIIRGKFDDYRLLLDQYQMEYAEVSDGSITIDHDEKCGYIAELSKLVTVFFKVESKDIDTICAPSNRLNR